MKRFRFLMFLIAQFVVVSTLLRMGFYVWSFGQLDFSLIRFGRVLLTGAFFDIGTVAFFSLPYVLFTMFLPARLVGGLLDKTATYVFYGLVTLVFSFSFFAEVTFWEEFESRFNFIAVDYLVYTWEVIENINQSYPLPLLFTAMIALVAVQFFIAKKLGAFSATFQHVASLKQKMQVLPLFIIVPLFFIAFVKNNHAEWSGNRYENELSKTGIYSFFSAFRTNELSYNDFYLTQPIEKDFAIVKRHLGQLNAQLIEKTPYDISRQVKADSAELRPNVIFICVESFSADFLTRFGSTQAMTPHLDSLINEGIFFENLYATGTRTIRGMEAITLSVPPSPGRSIVKRLHNADLYTIGDVFQEKGYKRAFFYGGDGYFDNMNQFFGSNGFDIVDRGRGYVFGDDFTANRTNIEDDEVTFENAWGVCDQDIYSKVMKEADLNHAQGKPFFNFIMTTSNHRPYTYPEGMIDIPSGEGRRGTVKYTDFAIWEFLEKAKQKPWFKNTVFAIMSDHCASSAGKWDLNVGKYHIPALILNLPNQQPRNISALCSQIDFFPTLFGYLNWSFTSHFYGRDVNQLPAGEDRAFIGNYRKLGLLKADSLWVLADQKKATLYQWEPGSNELKPAAQAGKETFEEVIAYYHSIDYLYQNRLLEHVKLQ